MLKAAPQRTRHLTAHDKLGKYEVIRQIAIGGMAELYLARTLGIEGFEKLVVIKRILPQYVTNAAFVNMFLNEARLAATLHHPNVAQVYDIGLEDGDYFFAMEYVHGEDLDHIQVASEEQGVPLSLDAALTLVAGLCAGLHYAHEKAGPDGRPLNIVHRDVSPSNVLVSYDGAVKLVDFGIARASSRPGTTEGGLKGKIVYMSPEQCRARAQLDRRSDLYSVGAILYELTTGQLPFSGETEYQILNQIVNEDAPPPSTVVPGYPAHLERIVMKALARDVDQRYATALEMQTDVEDFAHESRLRISPLVLARLMGTLFPTRLEEWDHAKARGGAYLEQHVVRTLIESGKTPDRSELPTPAQLADALSRQDAAIEAAQLAMKSFADDDQTALSPAPPQLVDLSDTTIGAAPISTLSDSMPFDRVEDGTGLTQPIAEVPAPPEPRKPTPYPMVTELMTATPGALVTAVGAYGGSAGDVTTTKQVEVTQRLRGKKRERASSPTTFVRATSRTPLVIALIGLLVTAGLVAAIITVRASESDVARPAAKQAPAAVEMTAKPEPGAAAAAAQTPVEIPPAPPPPPLVEATTQPATAPPARPAVAAKKPGEPVAAKPPEAIATKKPAEPAAIKKPTEPVAIKKPTEPVATKKPAEPAAIKKPAEPVAIKKPAEPAKALAVKKPAEPARAPAKKPAEPAKPKEPAWNADSPFMPVRTDKH